MIDASIDMYTNDKSIPELFNPIF